MILTGKCKEDFLTFINNYVSKNDLQIDIDFFPENLWNALIIDFFDEQCIYVNAIRYNNHYFQAYCNYCMREKYETRQEATTEAIKKANEIYNNR